MSTANFNLCLITKIPSQSFKSYLLFLEQAVKGGVTLVQLRDKNLTLNQLRPLALEIKALLVEFNVPFILNDHVYLAAEIDADGVHIGQSDFSPQQARQVLGEDKIIGYSVESLSELEKANQLDCISYIAASAVFPSQTKTNCKMIWGLEGLKQVTTLSKWPVIAIGGMTVHNVKNVMSQGANGIAVVSALHNHSNPFLAAKELVQIIQEGKSNV